MNDPGMPTGGGPWEPRRRSRRRIIIIVTVSVLVIALAAGTAGFLLLRTIGSPQQTAASYLAGWQRSDYPAMDQVTVGAPRSGLAGPSR